MDKNRKKPLATVIIPTYKRGDMALNLSLICKKYEPEIEIIIVDSSPEVDNEILKKASINNIRYIQIKEEEKLNSRNIGIKNSTSEIIIFFDDDIEIKENTIKEHIKAYQDKEIIGACGRVINVKDKIPKETDVITGKMNILGTNFLMNFWSTKEQYIDFVYGCNMSFRRSALIKVKDFKPLYAFEEIDMSLRLKKLGKIKFLPKAEIRHFQISSGGAREDIENVTKNYWKQWGSLIRNHVVFPLSLISLFILTYRSLKESYKYTFKIYEGYFK